MTLDSQRLQKIINYSTGMLSLFIFGVGVAALPFPQLGFSDGRLVAECITTQAQASSPNPNCPGSIYLPPSRETPSPSPSTNGSPTPSLSPPQSPSPIPSASPSISPGPTGTPSFPPTFFACEDGVDNDGDSYIDYPYDPGCSAYADNDESDQVFFSQSPRPPSPLPSPSPSTDPSTAPSSAPSSAPSTDPSGASSAAPSLAPSGAPSGASTPNPSPSGPSITYACSDGVDNDGDLFIDFPSDPGCSSSIDNDESNGLGGPGTAPPAPGP